MHRGLQNHAKYKSALPVHFLVLLLASKLLRTYGNFLSYDLLKVLHIVNFLFIIKAGSALLFVVLQKPFSSGSRVSKSLWLRIFRHSVFSSLLDLISLFGLSLCGPLRQSLLFEHGDLTIAAAISALASGVGGPAKSRGAILFIVAVLSLLLLDNDVPWAQHPEHPEGHHSTFIVHFFYHILSLVGVADHKGGVGLLCFSLLLRLAFNNASRRLSIDVGGAKRLHALSTLASSAVLAPWAIFVSLTKQSLISSSSVLVFLLAAVAVGVADYYMTQLCVSKMEAPAFAKYSFAFAASGALTFALFWNPPKGLSVAVADVSPGPPTLEHVVSPGVVLSYVVFNIATHILLSPNSRSGSRQGHLVGYSSGGLPFYSLQPDTLWSAPVTPPWVYVRNFVKQVMDEPDSRKIFYYLIVNLIFTFVEFIYGFWTNSLGLISDGFHMLFDCSALIMGLAAAMMSKWKPSRVFSFGYDRVEILSGFVNGLFLVVIAFFVFTEAITRLIDPPEVNTERLMTVSVAGLFVNLFGILVFRGSSHGHSHGGSSCSSGAGAAHGHSHAGGGGSHSNANMEGVFLHVLADTLGSLGVILSSFLIGRFGWFAADPICSLFIALLIFTSVIPLLKSSAQVLLLRSPARMDSALSEGLVQVQSLDGVLALLDYHFWQHSSSVVCGTLHLQVVDDVNEQKLVSQVSVIFKEVGVNNLTVQTMKGAFFAHKAGMSDRVDPRMVEVAQRSVQGLPLDPQSAAHIVKAV